MNRVSASIVATLLSLMTMTLRGQDNAYYLDQDVEVASTLPANAVFTLADGSPLGMTFALTPMELPPQTSTLLQTPRVLEELQLVDAQRRKLGERIDALGKTFQKKQEELARTPEAVKPGDYDELHRKYVADVQEAAEDVLLPFQQDRLAEIRLQAELRTRGSLGVESEAFAEFLKLSDAQREELREKAAEGEKKLEAEIKSLRKKMHRDVLKDVLTPEQFKLLDSRLGKPIAENEL